MKSIEQFTNLYKVSKTLRFELIPVGRTQEFIEKNGIIEKDAALASAYKEMKKTIDEYHKSFISLTLKDAKLDLEEYARLYYAPAEEKEAGQAFDRVKASLRKEIVAYFKARPEFKSLDKKELIKDYVKEWVEKSGNNLAYYEEFEKFTTYFTGYNTNRMNMYSEEEKSTAVAYRLIDENLPKFMDNVSAFDRMRKTAVADSFATLVKELRDVTGVERLDDVFCVSFYNSVLTQKGIDLYNTLIGGQKKGDVKIRGINEYINEYNQNHPEAKLPKMKILYKQILSGREAISWLPASFANANELLDSVLAFSRDYEKAAGDLKKAVALLSDCDQAGVFVRESAIATMSNRIFGDYSVLKKALGLNGDEENGKKKKEKLLSVRVVQSALDDLADSENGNTPNSVAAYFASNLDERIERMSEAYGALAPLLNSETGEDYKLTQNDKNLLKAYLDSAIEILHLVKPLYIPADSEGEKDLVFYGSFTEAYEMMTPITMLYDMVRNFATKKPYSDDKIKLNFNIKGNFLNGWVDSKTDNSDNGTQYGGYLFRKRNPIDEYDYYLGVSESKKLFRAFVEVADDDKSDYERLDYYQLKPESFYGVSYKGDKTYNEDKDEMANIIISMSKNRLSDSESAVLSSKTTPKGMMKHLREKHAGVYKELLADSEFKRKNAEIITALKHTLGSLSRVPEAQELAKKNYMLFEDWITEIDSLLSRKFFNYYSVSKKEFESVTDTADKPLYLFKITNKDLSFAKTYSEGKRKSRGKENLHTMYFKALMEGGRGVFDIGAGEIFFRKKTEFEKITIHPAGTPIDKKNPNLVKNGKKSVFEYDIIKDKRFAENKYKFHISTILNYNAAGVNNINQRVCDYIKDNPDINIIGIDRGERHLLYISMIDRNGNVVKDENGKYIQYSLNTITGSYRDANGKTVPFETPYRQLLDQKEKERDEARRNWDSIENIKELKEGYMSQVVHHIAGLMVKYNAIVVMEDLNSGFKRGRIKVEKQVYQKFEKALIDKLNYLVFKDYSEEEPGGLYKALQLANPFESFKKMGKQSGFLFYVPAWNTSKIDPVTGFVDLLKPKYESVARAREFFNKFDCIRYDKDNDWFAFEFDYKNFAKDQLTRTKWTVCTHGELRYAFDKSANNNKGGYVKRNVTESLKKLFAAHGVDYLSESDIKADIVAMDDKAFFISLMKNLQVTLAMRYSSSEDGKDFILSPVADANGEFYCSEGRTDGLPQDADANGAFNIARKGLMVLRSIDKAHSYKDWSTKIKNIDWLNSAQSWS